MANNTSDTQNNFELLANTSNILNKIDKIKKPSLARRLKFKIRPYLKSIKSWIFRRLGR